MMGQRQVDQAALFYEFSLERHVPATHLLRSIDRFVDLSDIRSHVAPFYSCTGRPSIDPELLVRMLLVGYCYGIRSERRLCEEVHLNLAYRWFCRLGLDGEVPDHSTFSKNRHGRFRDCDLLRKLFETVVQRCMAEGLVDGAAFAVDASLIAADANKQRSAAASDEVDWDAIAKTRRSVREYLDTLDEAAWGAASETVPKFISKSDPAAQWTGAHKGHAFFAYANNYLIDLKAAIIVDVEATRAIRQAEVGAARTMIERTEDRLGLSPERVAADSAYGSAEMLGWLVNERAIEPHIPVFDKSARIDGTFSREAFAYDQQSDVYICPAGKVLASTGTLVNDGATLLYRASKHDCDACELKARCCPKMPSRKVPRSIHEKARDVAREIAKTEAYVTSRRERKKIEMLFAHLKRILRLDRLRLRGPSGARDEFLLAATAPASTTTMPAGAEYRQQRTPERRCRPHGRPGAQRQKSPRLSGLSACYLHPDQIRQIGGRILDQTVWRLRPVRCRIQRRAARLANAVESAVPQDPYLGARHHPECGDLEYPVPKAVKIAKPKYGLHSLRHAAASLWIQNGTNAKRIQTLMGHSSITITYDRYGHWFADEAADQKAAEDIQFRLLGK